MGMPKNSVIAKYWLCSTLGEKEYKDMSDFEKKLAQQDIGEPSCWACGRYEDNNNYDYVHWGENEPIGKESLTRCLSSWNKASFLERCHIIPKSLGGTDDASNLLLLCKPCHKESPDLKNPKYIKRWVAEKENFQKELYHSLANMLKYEENAGLSEYICKNNEAFLKYVIENGTTHFGVGLKDSTIICLMESFYEESKKDLNKT